ncbi:MAG: hypothetical protein AVDCRST_MAG23-1051, partial [uncultured Sphingosinicella sp.]
AARRGRVRRPRARFRRQVEPRGGPVAAAFLASAAPAIPPI